MNRRSLTKPFSAAIKTSCLSGRDGKRAESKSRQQIILQIVVSVFHDNEFFVIGTNIKTNKDNRPTKQTKKSAAPIFTAKMIRLAPSKKIRNEEFVEANGHASH
jgi:hypothetical protein